MTTFTRILGAIVFVGLLLVLPLAVVPYGTVDAWWEAAVECFIFSLTGLWMIEALCGHDWQLRRLSVVLPLVVITTYAFVQAVSWPPGWLMKSMTPRTLSIDHYQTYLTARKSLALTLFFTMLLGHTSSINRYRWLVRSVIGVGLASALFAILRQFLQAADSPAGFVLPFLIYGTGYGQFISPNPFAYLMEMSLGLTAGLILGGGIGKNRVLIYVAILAVLWTALVLSNSRGGITSFACQSIFVLYFGLRWYSERKVALGEESSRVMDFMRTSKLVRAAGILIVLVAITVGVLWMGGDSLAIKLAGKEASASETSDGATRQEIWRASWKLFRNNPWTGTGFGAFFLGIPQFQLSSGRFRLEQAHNDYLDLAASGGIIGFILGGWFVFAVVRRGGSNFQRSDAYLRAAALGAATGLLGVAVHSLVDFGLQLTGIALVCATVTVLLVADLPRTDRVRRNSRNEGPSRRRLRLTTDAEQG